MIAFIDDHREVHGVEPICRVLKIAPSIYYAHDARRRRPDTAPRRVQRASEKFTIPPSPNHFSKHKP